MAVCLTGKKLTSATSFDERFERCIYPEPMSGCWLWVGAVSGLKYGKIIREGKRVLAHRYSYQKQHGPIPNGMEVRHKCDNTFCVNPDHLEVGTHLDNMRDRLERGNYKNPKGSDHHKAILNEDDVTHIKKQLQKGTVGARLAEEYNVSVSTVSLINRGKIWRHVL